MMILSSIAPIAKEAIARNLFSDPLLVRKLTYRRFTSNSYNKVTGVNSANYTETPVDVVEMKHTADSVKASSVKVEVGMILFLIQYDSLAFVPNVKDTLYDSSTGVEYAFRGVDKIFNILYTITVTDRRNPS